ncbi:MAG: hypothetical protein AAF849_17030 [Bacteroidota bacterium]
MSQLPSTVSPLERVASFHKKELWRVAKKEDQLSALLDGIHRIREEVVQIATDAEGHLEEGIASKEDYFILYDWVAQAKALMLLWRDTLFQEHKAEMLYKDQEVLEEELQKLLAASQNTLQAAHESFRQFLEEAIQKIDQKQIEKWKHQKSPWSVYEEQIEEIEQQSQKLFEQHETLSRNIGYFRTIQSIINNLLKDCDKEIDSIKQLSPKTDQFIREHLRDTPDPKFGRVVNYLEELEKNFSINHHLKAFLDRWENEKLNLPNRKQYTVGLQEGLLLYKEIDLSRGVRQWIDSEILPLLYEAWELLERIEHEFKVSIANIRNRTILLSKEEQALTEDISNLCFPLETFLKKTSKNEALFADIAKMVAQKLNEEFQLSRIFDPGKAFLAVPFQNTVSQLRLNQSSLLSRIYNWWRRQYLGLQRVRKKVSKRDVLSLSERIARLIEHRKTASDNLQYASIFQTEGYIGESFYVGREEEMKRVEVLVKQWYEGFRGALLLTGQRFSGKTLFGEYFMNRHFSSNTIVLSPNMPIEVQGRKFTTTYDLYAALNFIQKYSINQRPMVWIDDLELWHDPQKSLGRNVRCLFEQFDKYSTRIFFTVSMSNWMKAHLNKYYNVDKLFQATINLDRMEAEDIKEAILVRHGATHKLLMNAKGTEIKPAQFQRLSNRIYKQAEGNIGEALMRWSYAIQATDDQEKVQFVNTAPRQFPDFLTPDIALLLSTIMMEKKTNEYRLRKLFGAPFNEKYSGILQRLLNVGVLKRDLSGWLEINEYVVNDIGRLLERKKYISFRQD